ncbi:AAA family ATPase [Rhodopirellula islandica]|nr:histidine kinase [Rhodopirellula islandica]
METWILHECDDKANALQKGIRDLGLQCPPERSVELCPESDATVDPFSGERLVFLVVNQIQTEHFTVLHALKHAGDCKVVVVATEVNPDSILELFRAGATDFVRWGESLIDEVGKVISRLRSETVHKRCDGKMLAVIPTASISDSNLLSCNLAATIAGQLGECSLIDMRVGGGDLAAMLKLEPEHTLRSLLNQDDGVDQSMVEQAMACHPSGIKLLASPPICSRMSELKSEWCETILNMVSAGHTCSVVHLDDPIQAEDLGVLESFDAIVLATRLDIVSLLRTKEYLRFLKSKQKSDASIHVIAMGTGHAGELPVKSVEKLLKLNAIHTIPDDPVAVTMSLNMGNPIVLESSSSPIAKAIREATWTIPTIRDLVRPDNLCPPPRPKGLLNSIGLSLVSGLMPQTH